MPCLGVSCRAAGNIHFPLGRGGANQPKGDAWSFRQVKGLVPHIFGSEGRGCGRARCAVSRTLALAIEIKYSRYRRGELRTAHAHSLCMRLC
jgi:hypothetical protein